jgi:stage II sporulation protein D
MLRLITLTAIALLAASCVNMHQRAPEPTLVKPIPAFGAAPLVRVKLSKPSQATKVEVDAGTAWLTIDGTRTEAEGLITLERHQGGAYINGRKFAHAVEIVGTENPAKVIVNDHIYRGRLRVLPHAEGWDVINVVDLEQYVAGVIGWEMIAGWPLESLKAQAVASRSYAVFEMQRARERSRQWDMDDTTQYQVYGGIGPRDKPREWRETASVLAAREQTNGMVLTYQGKGFRAFFHSTSGGHTTNPIVGFGINETLTPLQGVDLGDFGKDSPRHTWEVSLTESEVNARLIEARLLHDKIIRIDRAETATSGHAVALRLFNQSGHFSHASAVDVRRALRLPSTNFDAVKLGDEWTFTGRGFGHGCGMCQWSARGMAAAGWNAERILQTMYPGADLTALY